MMTSLLAKFELRSQTAALKLHGRIPEFSWIDVARTFSQPCNDWPAERLAVPQGEPDAKGLVTYRTPIGLLSYQPWGQRIVGLLAIEEMRGVYDHPPVSVKQGDIVIDLGANIGSFSRYALSKGAAKVIAFEPEPLHIDCLEKAFAEDIKSGRMIIVKAAAWREKTTLHFESSGLTSHISDGGISIPAVTIDETVKELNLPRVDFIKADIEGAEREALAGAKWCIATFAPRMALCIYHLPDDPQVITSLITDIRAYQIWHNSGKTQAFFAAGA